MNVAGLVGATVLFDLDGTLTDPFVGITSSIRHALESLGYPAPPADELGWCIGPPLTDSFPVLLGTGDPAMVADAVRLYRERYSEVGKFENRLIDGIPEALDGLVGQGAVLYVATSKLASYAGEIVEHFGLMPHFRAVHGVGADGRHATKAELIRHILASEPIDADRVVMIGDRRHDVEGARANGIRSLGVLWGYGDRAELEAAGADWIVEETGGLADMVGDVLGGAAAVAG